MPVIIRPIQVSDTTSVHRFINQLSAEDTYILFSGEKITLAHEKKYIANLVSEIAKGQGACLVAELDGQVVAMGEIMRYDANKKRSLHLGRFSISVLKDYRQQGIGKKLATSLIESAKKDITNLRAVVLTVFANNHVAHKLYQSLGFQEVGRVPDGILHKNQYVDEIYMHLPL